MSNIYLRQGDCLQPIKVKENSMNKSTPIDEQIDNILLEHIVLATDNGQPYIKSTDTAVEAIKQLINQARIDELEKLLADGGQCICQLADQEVCDHNWSLCNTVKDRIAELKGE